MQQENMSICSFEDAGRLLTMSTGSQTASFCFEALQGTRILPLQCSGTICYGLIARALGAYGFADDVANAAVSGASADALNQQACLIALLLSRMNLHGHRACINWSNDNEASPHKRKRATSTVESQSVTLCALQLRS